MTLVGTLIATLAAVVIVAGVLLIEVQNLANIFEALSTGYSYSNDNKNDKAGKVNWKEAYAAR